MEQIEPRFTPRSAREATAEYLIDMIDQLARLARQSGEPDIAIHLEAITAARRATARDLSG